MNSLNRKGGLLLSKRRTLQFVGACTIVVAATVCFLLNFNHYASATGLHSIVFDTDGDFNSGSLSSTVTSGTGAPAVLQLAGWQYRKIVTIDHTKVTADQSNFPVLVAITADANLAAHAQATANDILFTAADGTTKLNYEIESYNPLSGALTAWVQVPSVSAATDTPIDMYYGNSSVTSQQNASGVWDTSYRGVWHLNQSCATAQCILDSTISNDGGTPYSNLNSSTLGNLYTSIGKISGAQIFNGSSTSINTGASSLLDIGNTNTLAISAWVKRATPTATGTFVYHGVGGVGGYMLGVGETPCGQDQLKLTKFGVVDICTGALPEDTNWHYVAEVGDGNTTSVYVDGALSGTSSDTENWKAAGNQNLYIGSQDSGYWNGAIDEVRVSSTNRSPSWIATEYNNQNNPSAFFSLGNESTSGSIAASGSWESPQMTLGNNASWGDGTNASSTAVSATVRQINTNQTVQLQIRTGTSLAALHAANYVNIGTMISGTTFSLTKFQLENLGITASKYMQLKANLTQSTGITPQLDNVAVNYYVTPTVPGTFTGPAPPPGTTAYPSGLISKNVPAFASPGSATSPSQANDASDYSQSYSGFWLGTIPGWIAYKLSSVPQSMLHNVNVAWFNDPMTSEYDHTVDSQVGYNNLSNYTIECSYQDPALNTVPSDTSWEVLASVTGNTKHSRQSVVDMSGCNWIRLNITGSDGSPSNTSAAINMDIYTVPSSVMNDDWIFYGDSITQGDLHHAAVNGVGNMSQLVHQANASYFPLFEDGGIGGTTSATGAMHITNAGDTNDWLSYFPGRYVTLDYGTNDANNGCSGTAITNFYNNYVSMIQAVIAAGKTPVIPYIPWAPSVNVQTCAGAPNGSGMNGEITRLYQQFPQIIHGPDLWDLFNNQPSMFVDNLHPNAVGDVMLRIAWANTMMQNVYALNILPEANQGLSGLHISGNKLLNQESQPIILRGVNRSGTEYACEQGWGIFDGPNNQASIQAMKGWGINAVNIPLNEDCWLGINGVTSSVGSTVYQQAIIDYVQLLESNGIYPVLSLQWGAPSLTLAISQPAMTDEDHAPAFWTSVAQTFKNDSAVTFKLLEEPHPDNNRDSTAAWQCWKNGGTCANVAYSVAGFQELIDDVRGTGSQNVIGLPGIQYANTMTQFLNYLPADVTHNLMAVADVYPKTSACGTVTCYNNEYLPVLTTMPFMAGEFGASADGTYCGTDPNDIFMDWMDQQNSGYMAWTWNTWGTNCGDLSLILNYDGTPKAPNGVDYKTHLLALLSANKTTAPSVPSGTSMEISVSPMANLIPAKGLYNGVQGDTGVAQQFPVQSNTRSTLPQSDKTLPIQKVRPYRTKNLIDSRLSIISGLSIILVLGVIVFHVVRRMKRQ